MSERVRWFLRLADPSTDEAWRRFTAAPDPIPADVLGEIIGDAVAMANETAAPALSAQSCSGGGSGDGCEHNVPCPIHWL